MDSAAWPTAVESMFDAPAALRCSLACVEDRVLTSWGLGQVFEDPTPEIVMMCMWLAKWSIVDLAMVVVLVLGQAGVRMTWCMEMRRLCITTAITVEMQPSQLQGVIARVKWLLLLLLLLLLAQL
jgi:hypothetical protein